MNAKIRIKQVSKKIKST